MWSLAGLTQVDLQIHMPLLSLWLPKNLPIIVDSSPRYPHCDYKSIELPDFAYSFYSNYLAFLLTFIHSMIEHSSNKEVILNPFWQKTMTNELYTLHKLDIWDIAFLPLGKIANGSRQVYKIKAKSDGYLQRYKACLVAKEFTQQYVMNYEETFVLVAKMTTICTLIVVASIRQQHIFQMDVKNVFLNNDLQKEVYMVPPRGVLI